MSFAVGSSSVVTPAICARQIEASHAPVRIGRPAVALPAVQRVRTQSRGPAVVRASSEQPQESSMKKAEKAVVAGALAVLLGLGNVGVANAAIPDSTGRQTISQGSAATDILEKAKRGADATFAEAQNQGKETVGDDVTKPKLDSPYPKDSQISSVQGFETNPGSKGSNDSVNADSVSAPTTSGTSSQQQKEGQNPIERAFGTPVRGAEQARAGPNDKTGAVDREGRKEVGRAGEPDTYVQGPQLVDRIKSAFENSVTPSNPTSTISGLLSFGDAKSKASDVVDGVKSNAVASNVTDKVQSVFGGSDPASSVESAKSDIGNVADKAQAALPDSVPSAGNLLDKAQAALPNLPSLPKVGNVADKAQSAADKAQSALPDEATSAGNLLDKAQAALPNLPSLPKVGNVADKAQSAAGTAKSALPDLPNAGNVLDKAQASLPDLPSIPNPAEKVKSDVQAADSQLTRAKNFVDEQVSDTKADIAKLQAEQKERNKNVTVTF